VRSLLLASRRGDEAEGAVELQVDLESLGARVRIAACDVADRSELERLLGLVPEEHPLSAVIHAAGILDDGVIESQTPERVDRVLAPKLDAAWHLHELTSGMDLSAFVLFSSGASTFGGAGQAGYSAANAFLDALATYRRALGLPGIAMAWGQWAQASRMTDHLTDVNLDRLARSGLPALSSAQVLELFDATSAVDEPVVVPVRLDLVELRAQAKTEAVHVLLRDLIRAPVARAVAEVGVSLAQRLSEASEGDRERVVLEMVRGEVASVLGHESSAAVGESRAFKELGFDSLVAIELRNRLNRVTGMRLPSTLIFNYPTPIALARHLLSEMQGKTAVAAVDAELDRLDSSLASVAELDAERARIATRLRSLLTRLSDADEADLAIDVPAEEDDLQSATDDEMFSLIDKELGAQ
jgi:acyl carrier protein